MSKTVKELGLILGGLAIAVFAAPVGIIVLEGNLAVFHAMVGIGLTTALSGVGLALRQQPAQPVGTANSISFNSGVSPRRVIYGQFQTAGVLTYASFPAGQNLNQDSQFLHLVYTLAAHEISSFDGVVVNGTAYNFGTDILKDAGLPSTPWQVHPAAISANDLYWQHLFFEFDFGDNANTQPFPNLAASDPAWTSDFTQRGCAKVHVICRYDVTWTNLFPSGQIPNFQFLVTGKKLIDPRVATDWAASTSYPQYSYIVDQSGILWFQQTVGSPTSGSSRPAFESSDSTGSTLTDGGITWYCPGLSLLGTICERLGGLTPQLYKSVLYNDAWAPGTTYGGGALNTVIEAPIGYLQLLTTSGSTSVTHPNFATTRGSTTTDNTSIWTCLGRSTHAINPSNSALAVFDYLQETNYGMKAPLATIDTTSVIAAANVCEEQELIIWNADNTTVFENLYACDGMFDYSSTRGNVLTALCGSMAGWVVPPGDLWHVFAGAYTSPILTITDDDLRGPLKGDFRLSSREVANSIKGTYVPAFLPTNPGGALSLTQVPGTWQAQSFPAYQANGLAGKPDYIDLEDGGEIIWQDIQLDFTTSLWRAQRLAKITLMRH